MVEEQEDDEGDETESEDVASEVIEAPAPIGLRLRPAAQVSPEASAEQPKALGGSTCGRDQRQERRFGLWRSQTKDKVDLSGLKDFVQVHVTLGGGSECPRRAVLRQLMAGPPLRATPETPARHATLRCGL